jgi:hypothetical protein
LAPSTMDAHLFLQMRSTFKTSMLALVVVTAGSVGLANAGCGGYNGGMEYAKTCGCDSPKGSAIPLTRALYAAGGAATATCIPDYEFYRYEGELALPALPHVRHVGVGMYTVLTF